jgi:hypothetical protein
MHYQFAAMDSDELDEDQRKTNQRRMSMYSTHALMAAKEVDNTFVAHTAFSNAVKALDRAFQLGRELSVPQGVMVMGPTGAGKTTLNRYFLASLPPSTLFEQGLGAITLRLQERPVLGRLVSTALTKLRYPFPKVSDQTVSAKRSILIESLNAKGTRLILVDEAGHMCGPGVRKAHAAKTGNEITEFFCELMDEAHVALGLSGNSQLEALDQIDPALAARVSTRERFSDFDLDGIWYGFLKAFKDQCKAFDLSFLCSEGVPTLLHAATGGNARRFKALAIEAVLIATDKGAKTLNRDILESALRLVNGTASIATNPFATARVAS